MKTIILAGGSGTRLWPLSRTYYPKQFLTLKDMDRSIFQMSFERCLKLTQITNIYIVTNQNYNFLVQEQIESLGYKIKAEQILLEPESKNTLPAIYYAVREIQKHGEDIVAVFPSDHLIHNEDKFIQIIKESEALAEQYLITYGILPTKPHTGYGYIKPAEPLVVGYRVAEFKEKPDYQTALAYLNKGYLWNSGMFMFSTNIFTEEVQAYNQEVAEAFKLATIDAVFAKVPNISIDYGIMEKSKRVATIPFDIIWNDLGNFDNFYDEFNQKQDKEGNISFNKENILIDSDHNFLYTDQNKTIALVGTTDLIVIDEKDALLICKKGQSQKVKEVVAQLKANGNSKEDLSLTTHRPWGSFSILEEGIFYKIKRITVLPGKKLSLQLHYHRNEHWVVVKGAAKVTLEDSESLIRLGESIFIQAGFKHRLENPGKIPLEVIEVQIGEYLEEDDIVRLEDDFGRGSRF